MSVNWEQVAEYTGGDMVGGELFVRKGREIVSLGKLVGPTFYFSEEGLKIANEIEAGASEPEVMETVAELAAEPVVEPPHEETSVHDLL